MSEQRVPLGPIQDAVKEYLERGHTYQDICIQLEWYKSWTDHRRKPQPDTLRFRRCIGLADMYSSAKRSDGRGHRYKYRNKSVSRRNAIAIIRAIDRAPVEFGL